MTIPPPSARLCVEVGHSLGLHLRVAGEFVSVSQRFAAEIRVRHGGADADGKSVISLLCLAAGPGSVLELEAHGPDAPRAVEALAELISARSHETGARSLS